SLRIVKGLNKKDDFGAIILTQNNQFILYIAEQSLPFFDQSTLSHEIVEHVTGSHKQALEFDSGKGINLVFEKIVDRISPTYTHRMRLELFDDWFKQRYSFTKGNFIDLGIGMMINENGLVVPQTILEFAKKFSNLRICGIDRIIPFISVRKNDYWGMFDESGNLIIVMRGSREVFGGYVLEQVGNSDQKIKKQLIQLYSKAIEKYPDKFPRKIKLSSGEEVIFQPYKIALAKENIKNVEFIQAEFKELKEIFKHTRFDYGRIFNINLHYFPEEALKNLKDIAKVFKEGGVLVEGQSIGKKRELLFAEYRLINEDIIPEEFWISKNYSGLFSLSEINSDQFIPTMFKFGKHEKLLTILVDAYIYLMSKDLTLGSKDFGQELNTQLKQYYQTLNMPNIPSMAGLVISQKSSIVPDGKKEGIEARNEQEELKIHKSIEFLKTIDRKLKVTFVMPMYKEEARLLPQSQGNPLGEDALRNKIKQSQLLHRINSFYQWQIIAVDDGSPGASSAKCVEELWAKIRREYEAEGEPLRKSQVKTVIITPLEKKILGSCKGGAVLRGLSTAISDGWADYIGYTDVDISTDLRQAGVLIKPLYLGKAEVAIGSRKVEGGVSVNVSPFRMVASKVYDLCVYIFLPQLREIKDTHRGFKLFKKEVLARIIPFAKDMTVAFDTELLLLAKFSGYAIYEVSIAWFDSAKASTMNIVAQGFIHLNHLFKQRKHIFSNEKKSRLDEFSKNVTRELKRLLKIRDR
ncbi:MAG: hypothetical protein K9L61_03725, partial [Candidatus Omnitrophica bacterium]|nr:hypothetical protein [Candidatus Omnitrophota bacterium]